MGAFYHITNPPQRDPPMPEAYSLLPPSGYGQPPQRPQALTITEQLQATYDVHSKQMSPPPGDPLFFAERTYDDAGVSGITLDHTKQFTKDHLEAYSPG